MLNSRYVDLWRFLLISSYPAAIKTTTTTQRIMFQRLSQNLQVIWEYLKVKNLLVIL